MRMKDDLFLITIPAFLECTCPYYHLRAHSTIDNITNEVVIVNKLFQIAISIVHYLWREIFLSLFVPSSIKYPLSLTLSGY